MMPYQIIKIRYLADIDPIILYKNGDWIDLRAAEDVVLEKGEYKRIPLGVAIKLPEGFEAIIAPRSSTAENFGIVMAGSIGVIDESYCGDSDEWKFPAIAIRKTTIWKNDRICQFRIVEHQPGIVFRTVEHLDGESRGGFGTSGKR